MKKFKIAIDVSPLNDGNKIRGVGYYTKNLLEALNKEIKINPSFKHYQIQLITEQSQLNNDYDLIHFPYFDPFKLSLPKPQKPYIVTCHDLIPRAFREHFPVGIKGEIIWLIQKHKLEGANYIICPSHNAKYQILDHLKYPPDQIFVTYEAATSGFKKINDNKSLLKVKLKYHLPDKFVLYVGDINWNKNIPTLVKACLNLKYPLVIAGSAATKIVPKHPWTKDIHWLQSQKSDLLHLLGFVPDEDLPYIYNLATIYCQPSFSEGFGLPLIEAMQCGTPVCYSEDSCLPEIMNFNGEFFDPNSQDSLESSLSKLWINDVLRKNYSKSGLSRAKHFSWRMTAVQTLSVYHYVELNEKK
jgi:glycosyltransferase involved in cell wall biosynthesis